MYRSQKIQVFSNRLNIWASVVLYNIKAAILQKQFINKFYPNICPKYTCNVIKRFQDKMFCLQT